MRSILTKVLEVLGAACVVLGVSLMSWRAGLVAAGVGLIIAGFLADVPRPADPELRAE